MEHRASPAAPASSDRGLLTAITPHRSPGDALPTRPQPAQRPAGARTPEWMIGELLLLFGRAGAGRVADLPERHFCILIMSVLTRLSW